MSRISCEKLSETSIRLLNSSTPCRAYIALGLLLTTNRKVAQSKKSRLNFQPQEVSHICVIVEWDSSCHSLEV